MTNRRFPGSHITDVKGRDNKAQSTRGANVPTVVADNAEFGYRDIGARRIGS